MNPDSNTRAHRSTKPELEVKINIVSKLVLQGYTRADLIRFGAEKWGVRVRQIETYLQKARAEIRQMSAADKDYYRCLALSRFENLYQMAYKNQDWGLCQRIQESINRLLGLNADVGIKVAVTGSISPDKWLTDNAE